jgi:peptidoglycan/LPS O-acetylase OafA/YrhL
VHPVTLSLAVHVVSRVAPKDAPVLLPVILLALAGIAGGLIYHALIERPLIQRLRLLVGPETRPAQPKLHAAPPRAKEVK